jgi:hypothetical protein
MTMRIDQLQPDYDARLLRHADVPQPPAVVRQAMEAVTFADLPTLSLLGRIRSFGRRGQRNPEPIFSGMRHADFVHVDENDDEIAAAMAGTLWRIRKPFVPLPHRDRVLDPDPCWAVTVSSYRIEPRDAGSRFVSRDAGDLSQRSKSARKFRPYWTLIGRLGATVYARDLVAAIRRRSAGQPRR